jgi:hypothetical protein
MTVSQLIIECYTVRMARRAAPLLAAVLACGTSSNGAPPDSGADAALDATAEAGPLAPPCSLSVVGAPTPIVSFVHRHATAPSMSVLDDGATSGAVSLGIAVFANAGNSGLPDDIEIARAHVADPWPAGATLDQQPELQGEFSLGAGLLATSADAPRTLGLVWHRDDAAVGRPQFRGMDVATWTQQTEQIVTPSGDTVFSFAAGAGVAADGSWSGDGFVLTWRYVGAPGVGPARPLGALVDTTGAVLRGPSALATAEDFPGRSPAVTWTGTNYLVATSYDACLGGDACVAHSVVVQRLRPNSGDAGTDFSLVPIIAIPALDPTTQPGTASLASFAGHAWVAWTEGPPADAGVGLARIVRVAELDGDGHNVGSPVTVAGAAHPTTHVAVSAGDAGILVTWPEDGAPEDAGDAVDTMPGASFVVVQRLGYDGTLDAPIRIPATRVDDFAAPTSATVEAPRGALVLWAGRATDPNAFDVTWLARLDCGSESD